MSKPRIKLLRRAGFTRRVWECRGPDCFGNQTFGCGLTPGDAYRQWHMISKIHF